MPVKIWEASESGLSSRIVTDWDTIWTSEEYREEAEELDRQLDEVLDGAVKRIRDSSSADVPPLFLRAWAVGRALLESGVFDFPALRNERRQILWKALAAKWRTGARSTHEQDRRWLRLRPSQFREPRREGGRLDYFEMCKWLAEQDLQDAADTFGGSIRNVWQMLERPALRPISLRKALREWLDSQPQCVRQRLYAPPVYAEMMKELRRRWPDRGPGSAKRPIHYEYGVLSAELRRALTPFASRLSERSGGARLTR